MAKEIEKTVFPRLTTNCLVQVKGHVYRVHFWNLSRTYEFVSETAPNRIKTELEVRDLIIQRRILILDDGLADAWRTN